MTNFSEESAVRKFSVGRPQPSETYMSYRMYFGLFNDVFRCLCHVYVERTLSMCALNEKYTYCDKRRESVLTTLHEDNK